MRPRAGIARDAALSAEAVDRIPCSLGCRSVQPNLGNVETDLVFLWPVDGAMRQHSGNAVKRSVFRPVVAKLNASFCAQAGYGDFFPESQMAFLVLSSGRRRRKFPRLPVN